MTSATTKGITPISRYIRMQKDVSAPPAAMCELLPETKGASVWVLLAALILHTAGDVLLLFDDANFLFFAAGLGAFLLGHWCYLFIITHGLGRSCGWKEVLCMAGAVAIAPVAVGALGATGAMRYAIMVYFLTLLLLVAIGAIRALRGMPLSWRIIAGGLLFTISDGLIAVCVFRGIDFPIRHALVLGTYLPAEYLLVSGMVKRVIPTETE